MRDACEIARIVGRYVLYVLTDMAIQERRNSTGLPHFCLSCSASASGAAVPAGAGAGAGLRGSVLPYCFSSVKSARFSF